jgi:hypothetical protein
MRMCFEKGTPEYKAFWKELEEKAELLKKLDREHKYVYNSDLVITLEIGVFSLESLVQSRV